MSKVTTLVPWYGSNRTLAHHVGELLAGCHWVGVPFAGGVSELLHIGARTLMVNDLHRHVINLANVLRHRTRGPELIRRLRRTPFHPDTLFFAQLACQQRENGAFTGEDSPLAWAEDFFVASWMGRHGKAGTRYEFRGAMSVRWTGTGGDSATRFRTATESLQDWRRVMPRCTFSVMDVFAFLELFRSVPGHGLYVDPPFPDKGRDYRHKPGGGERGAGVAHPTAGRARVDRIRRPGPRRVPLLPARADRGAVPGAAVALAGTAGRPHPDERHPAGGAAGERRSVPRAEGVTMSDVEFRALVRKMRETQREYFKSRTADVLARSKDLERQVDAELKAASRAEEPNLFSDHT